VNSRLLGTIVALAGTVYFYHCRISLRAPFLHGIYKMNSGTVWMVNIIDMLEYYSFAIIFSRMRYNPMMKS
jgi:hypothetical protein